MTVDETIGEAIKLAIAITQIAARAIANRGATHDQIAAEIDAAVDAYHAGLVTLDEGHMRASGTTDVAIAEAEKRIADVDPD